jgi:large subunit ribosomal protein L30
MAKLKITLRRSPIGAKPEHRRTARAMGLRRMHQTVIKKDDPAIRGMIRAISHMVEYEEIK